jgi:hypothetical protein
MFVLINGSARNLLVIERDFLQRRGRVGRLDQSAHFVLEGKRPLRACWAISAGYASSKSRNPT